MVHRLYAAYEQLSRVDGPDRSGGERSTDLLRASGDVQGVQAPVTVHLERWFAQQGVA